MENGLKILIEKLINFNKNNCNFNHSFMSKIFKDILRSDMNNIHHRFHLV